MARKSKARTYTDEAREAMRRSNHTAYVEALRDGRKERATTFADRTKVADRNACRGRHHTED
jgi:hypothetical protein